MIRARLFAALLQSIMLLGAALAQAAPPATINYQGTLTNASAQPVNGSQSMTFSLYAAATGGTALYSETQTVNVANGLFNVRIGAVTPLALPFDVPYFLGISVGGDAEMAPRQPLSSSAYAFRAGSAEGVAASATIPAGQVSGSLVNATIPAANVVGGGAGGGTVTSVATGAGLSGGPITSSGTINLAATNLLPTTACTANQIPKWSGTAWACATDNATPAGGVNGEVLAGSAGGPVWSPSLALSGNLALADSSATAGNILKAGSPFLHSFGTGNVFLGKQAGNLALSGHSNTSIGTNTLQGTTIGTLNTAIGFSALKALTTGGSNVAVGESALLTATNGSSNVAVGPRALEQLTTGSQNIAIGASSGFHTTTGGNNIFIGNVGEVGGLDANRIRIGSSQLQTYVAGIHGASPVMTNNVRLVGVSPEGQLVTEGLPSGSVMQVNTGNGLTGGPITGSGTINLAATNLLPLSPCSAGQSISWSGSFWVCSTPSSGSVTSVAVGAGLTGGPITGSGTLNLATTNLLPTTACAATQIPRWSGTNWTCADNIGLPVGGASGALLQRTASNYVWSTNPVIDTVSTRQILTAAGHRMVSFNTSGSVAVGFQAGPFTNDGVNNTAIGANSMVNMGTGPFASGNIAVGAQAMSNATGGQGGIAIGMNALNLVTGGFGAIAIGQNALAVAAQTGLETVVGSQALSSYNDPSGGTNVALGFSALNNLAAGSGNLALGSYAGTSMTNGSNNVLLGSAGVATESGTVRLGNAGTHTRTFVAGVRGVTPAGAAPLAVIIDENGQLGTSGISGSGTVTSVATGAGLTGGPITASGTINLSATNLLPTTACAANQVPKWTGSAWACAADADTNSGGTVTSIAAGTGLTGGTITASGTIGLAATNLLPTTACASNEIAKWNGSAWACAADSALPAGGTAGQVLAGSAGGAVWTASPSLSGNLVLPGSSASAGNLIKDGLPFLHNFGSNNVFAGSDAGNFNLLGASNTALGVRALKSLLMGSHNVGVGRDALGLNQDGASNVAVGSSALGANSAGSSNAALGHDSLASLGEGNGNVALGASASRNATNSYFNTAVGNGSLLNNNGNYNIGIGNQAGSALTTGHYNIAIGHGGAAGESNTVRIGNPTDHTRTFVAGIRGVTPPGGSPLPVVIDANGQLGTGAAGSGGTVTSVATGPGLAGGPITATGTINLAATNLLPTTACATNQIPKWTGTAWACAADADANSGGTVTSIATGAGLTGGTITGSGTIGLAATNLLPTSACSTDQVPRWNGTQWACTGNVSFTGQLSIPATSAVSGQIQISGVRALHFQGTDGVYLGRGAGNFTSTGARATAIGTTALQNLTTGGSNTAVGYFAQRLASTGAGNTALGAFALDANAAGSSNTAIGAAALGFNKASLNTAVGTEAMNVNDTGASNTALGYRALTANDTGSNNIAIGAESGNALTAGSHNIAIANPGVAAESNTTRIGTAANQTRTFVSGIHAVTPAASTARVVSIDANGQLATEATAVGLGIASPENKLHIAESIDGNGIPSNHVVQIENTSTGSSPDVLALRIRTTGAVNAGMNFITFYNGDFVSGAGGADQTLGSIQGNGANSIVLAGAGNDFAEYLPKLDLRESFAPGEVVGIRGGKVTRELNGAEQLMVVSTGAIVSGNDPGEARRDQYVLIAFIGQADVKVAGPVHAGDYLVASGNAAIAVPPAAMNLTLLPRVVGRAWASSNEPGIKPVRAVVGVDRGNEALIASFEDRARNLEERIARLERVFAASTASSSAR
ncbi:MAG: hypothetical protein JNK75_05455 [Betaproteobacteria bacterium]|nr:hypothetical protein [Betaproteobacteria bacterium]